MSKYYAEDNHFFIHINVNIKDIKIFIDEYISNLKSKKILLNHKLMKLYKL